MTPGALQVTHRVPLFTSLKYLDTTKRGATFHLPQWGRSPWRRGGEPKLDHPSTQHTKSHSDPRGSRLTRFLFFQRFTRPPRQKNVDLARDPGRVSKGNTFAPAPVTSFHKCRLPRAASRIDWPPLTAVQKGIDVWASVVSSALVGRCSGQSAAGGRREGMWGDGELRGGGGGGGTQTREEGKAVETWGGRGGRGVKETCPQCEVICRVQDGVLSRWRSSWLVSCGWTSGGSRFHRCD